jgi:hypothetical protein
MTVEIAERLTENLILAVLVIRPDDLFLGLVVVLLLVVRGVALGPLVTWSVHQVQCTSNYVYSRVGRETLNDCFV